MMNTEFNLDSIEKRIIENEKLLNHKLGWRFINSSSNTLENNSGIALITLNPAGGLYEPGVLYLNNQENAYLDENWGEYPKGENPIQLQIKGMFEEIHNRQLNYSDYEELIRNSFMAHYIPFRSKNIADLESKKESIDLSNEIWTSFIKSPFFNFNLMICVGKEQFTALEKLIIENSNYKIVDRKFLPIGWGNYKSEICVFQNQSRKLKLVYLQHLSRFKIFNREKGQEDINHLMNFLAEE